MYFNNINMLGINQLGRLTSGFNGFVGGNNCFGQYGSIFTDCFGNTNFDAIAGFNVAQTLTNVIGMGIKSRIARKQGEKAEYENNKVEISNIDKQINDLKSKDAAKEIDESYDTNISNAKEKLINANENLNNKKELLNAKQKDLSNATTESEKTEIKQAIRELEKEIEEQNKEIAKLSGDKTVEGSIKYYEAQKEEAIEAKEKEIKDKIEELEAQKADLQTSVNNVTLDKANGTKLTRTPDAEFEKKLVDGKIDLSKDYNKGDMMTSINQFMNALDGTPEKLAKAKVVRDMYNNYFTGNRYSTSFKDAAQIAETYIDKYSN